MTGKSNLVAAPYQGHQNDTIRAQELQVKVIEIQQELELRQMNDNSA